MFALHDTELRPLVPVHVIFVDVEIIGLLTACSSEEDGRGFTVTLDDVTHLRAKKHTGHSAPRPG